MELPRQPGRKEPRFIHLFSGNEWAEEFGKTTDTPAVESTYSMTGGQSSGDRITELETAVSDLKEQMQLLRKDFDDFKKMLE
jgi:uncharacterized protein YceH (UPF0502 family)